MSKHKCGTCRYFQEARLASSGWCHHPQRKTTSDILIMVRKNELACRDEWSHDLWEGRTEAGSLAAPLAEPYSHHKMPPATEQDIAAVMLADKTPGANESRTAHGADDVVLSELGVAADPLAYAPTLGPVRDWDTATGRPVEPGTPATPVVDTGTRNAIIRAREAFRERARQEAVRTAEHARFAEPITEEHPVTTASNVPAEDGIEADAVVQQGVWIEDVSAPDSTGVALELSANDTLAAQPGLPDSELTQGDAAPGEARAQPAEDTVAAEIAPDELSKPGSAPSSLRDRWSRRLRPLQSDRNRADDSAPRTATSAHQDGNDESSTVRAASGPAFDTAYLNWLDEEPTVSAAPEREPASNSASASDTDANVADTEHREPYIAAYDNIDFSGPENFNDETGHGAVRGEIANSPVPPQSHFEEINDVVVEDDVTPDLAGLALSAHLPRTCRTCRDFRPAESGDRGWCANRWAFSHRRVVDADEQTPCESALGNWWLPVDEVWSDAADVSSHGQPTPLLDAWLPDHRGEEPAARRRS